MGDSLLLALRFLILVIALNLVRYLVAGPIEAATIFVPMHQVLPFYPEVFDNDFTTQDFCISLLYNFSLWFSATLIFHLMYPALRGGWFRRSLISYGTTCLLVASMAAMYMNHFEDVVRPFFFWSIVDLVITFTVVALANALLYPLVFRKTSPTF